MLPYVNIETDNSSHLVKMSEKRLTVGEVVDKMFYQPGSKVRNNIYMYPRLYQKANVMMR